MPGNLKVTYSCAFCGVSDRLESYATELNLITATVKFDLIS